MCSQTEVDLSKTFRILIASDIHLGFNEKHYERGKDSFTAFEEVLTLAKEEDVDLILLGGDLFHFNKPSFQTFQKTVELLREYCLGCRPIQFQIVSDQSDNFSHYSNFKYANYLDDNLNISMPVFSIHGNHDDPTGANHVSALDPLSSAGLINYFGKYTNFDEIVLNPILLQKANSKIALYGLGSVNEERLYRIVTEGKLSYCLPEDEDEWFKIVVVHQNRVQHSNTKYLPEKFLSSLPNLVVWGHEHESRPEPDYNDSESFFIYQPGSTVATSLCEAEAVPKHCGILEVKFNDITQKQEFRIETHYLKTVRPFKWQTLDIPDLISRKFLSSDEDSIREYCLRKVEEMIQTAKLEHTGDKRQPSLPLIRLRLEYNDESQQFHSAPFGAQFSGRVANHSDIITYVKRKENHSYEDENNFDFNGIRSLLDQEVIGERVNITDIIGEYFDKIQNPSQKLGLLSEKALTLAVIEMVNKDSNEAINDVFEAQKESFKHRLLEMQDLEVGNTTKIKEQIRELKMQMSSDNDSQDLDRILAESRNKTKNAVKSEATKVGSKDDSNDSDSDFGANDRMDFESNEEKKSSGRGKGGGRGRGKGEATKRNSHSTPRVSTQTTLNFEQPSNSSRRSARVPAKKLKSNELVYEISDSD